MAVDAGTEGTGRGQALGIRERLNLAFMRSEALRGYGLISPTLIVIMAFFLTGNDQTLPIFIYSQLRFANRLPGVVAMGAAIIIVSIIVVAFAEWLRRRGSHGMQDDTGL